MNARSEFAYRGSPVFLAVHERDSSRVDTIGRRLASFFGVRRDAIATARGATTTSFVILGANGPVASPWFSQTETDLAVSAHPVMHERAFGDANSTGLIGVVRDLVSNSSQIEDMPGAVSVMHHDTARDSVLAANDTFGVGRLYYRDSPGGAAISNSIPAVALTADAAEEQSRTYWDTYYVNGGGVNADTHIRGVDIAGPGSRIFIGASGRLVIRESHSVRQVLERAKDRPSDPDSLFASATTMLRTAAPFFKEPVSLGLSGGRDSRFVLALALNAGLDVRTFTKTPPDLEADIAERLHQTCTKPFEWSRRDAANGSTKSYSRKPTVPILERARDWFHFTGGDNWATFMRQSPVERGRRFEKSFMLSGAFGDFTRGHYYLEQDMVPSGERTAVRRFLRAFERKPSLVPADLRIRGALQMQSNVLDSMLAGFEGAYALDYSFLVNRMRRQFPSPATGVLLPMLSPQLVSEVFWQPPQAKLASATVRDLTRLLMPEWDHVPYFHEAAVGTDPAVTNKVTIQPTYWEVDRRDFFDSVEEALAAVDIGNVTMDDVRDNLAALPDGRNRTNTVYEIMFWQYASVDEIRRINQIKVTLP